MMFLRSARIEALLTKILEQLEAIHAALERIAVALERKRP